GTSRTTPSGLSCSAAATRARPSKTCPTTSQASDRSFSSAPSSRVWSSASRTRVPFIRPTVPSGRLWRDIYGISWALRWIPVCPRSPRHDLIAFPQVFRTDPIPSGAVGRAHHCSDTSAWGLWIVFDLVWIAVAAGAFATAGIIYVVQRKDLYSMGHAAVLMGLLSYSFVTVTLIADLGLPWHFYQLALQSPEQSAMFEVSWCVSLYVTLLLIEFLPVPFERWGLTRLMDMWRRWSGAYVAAAVTLFVFLL